MQSAVLKRLHVWLGIPLALYVFVMGVTGVLLVYREDITALAYPELRQPLPALNPLQQAAALETVAHRFAITDRFKEPITAIRLPEPGYAAYLVHPVEGTPWPYDAITLTPLDDRYGVLVAFEFLFDVHHELAAGEWGAWIVGVMGLAALTLLVTGPWLWWRGRRRFSLGSVLRWGRNRPAWLRSHKTIGLVGAPLVFVSMLTGVAMIFPQTARSTVTALLGDDVARSSIAAPSAENNLAADDLKAGLVVAATRFPDADVRFYIPPSQARPNPSLRLRQPAEWHPNGRTVVQVGDDTLIVDALASDLGHRVADAIYPVHAAKVGGPVWPFITLLTGLAACALAWLGFRSYWARRPRAKPV